MKEFLSLRIYTPKRIIGSVLLLILAAAVLLMTVSCTKIPDEETIWKKFIDSEEYKSYIEYESKDEDLKYVVYDVNSDQKTEMLITFSDLSSSFYYTYLFYIDGDGKVVKAYDGYGYNCYRFSKQYDSLLISPEFRPFKGAAEYPFYKFNGTSLEHNFTITVEEDKYYIADDSGRTEINDTSVYFSDAVNFDWKSILK